jgi:hypothetical protein
MDIQHRAMLPTGHVAAAPMIEPSPGKLLKQRMSEFKQQEP